MKIEQAQKEVESSIMEDIWKTIDEFDIRHTIYDVQMQGSYAKGTDLPSGSDMDIFIIFNTDIPQSHREDLGVSIGRRVLGDYDHYVKDATSKYVEAFFNYEGFEFEVQIVPIRHLTTEQIKSKQVDGKPITIGMERTPHQTAFMKKALVGKTEEVRKLKQWMKDNGLYDSSMKSQGFSGYATECLIHYLGSFDRVIEFFTNLKSGQVLGEGKPNNDNMFSIIDPVDPDRDLITAFSDEKIGRTIKVCQFFKKNGFVPSNGEPVEFDGVSISFKSSGKDEDIIVGQIRRTQKSVIRQVRKMGFNVPVRVYEINDFNVEVARTRMDIDGNNIKISFGVVDFNIPEEYEDDGVPVEMEKAVANYKKANDGCEFIEKDGRVKAIKKRKFTRFDDAVAYVIVKGDVQKTDVVKDIVENSIIVREKVKYENII